MGCWSIGRGRMRIEPEVTDELICEYFKFSQKAELFKDRYEIFPNPWFFDKDNCLVCFPGKFCEPSDWFEPVKDFFERRGYKLIGDPDIIWDNDEEFEKYAREQNYKYCDWRRKLYQVNCEYL